MKSVRISNDFLDTAKEHYGPNELVNLPVRGMELAVPLGVLESNYNLARLNASKVEGSDVLIPLQWLIGERVGY